MERTLAWLRQARFKPTNRILAGLPQEALLTLRSHLRLVALPRGKVLCEADERLTHVYFVEAGAVSLATVFEDGATAEMATVGREGMVSIGALLGADNALGRCTVTLPGFAFAIEACRFQRALGEDPKIRATCEVYAQAFLANLLQNVACNASHTVEQRCARSLLMCADQAGDHPFELTQESLAEMLGVRRSTVTVVACTLQSAGLIRYRRGQIAVVDRRGLEAVACQCYRIVREGYEGTVGWRGLKTGERLTKTA
jgi:CRP-like cAMP-binding protein